MQENTLTFTAVSPEEALPEQEQTVITRIPWKLSRLRYFCREGRILLFSGRGNAIRWPACAAVSLGLNLAIIGGKRILYLFGVLMGIPGHYGLAVLSDLLLVVLSVPVLMGMYLTLGEVQRGESFRPGAIFRLLADKSSVERCWKTALLMALPAILSQFALRSGLWMAESCLLLLADRQDWTAPTAAAGVLLLTAGMIWLLLITGQRLRLTARIAWDHPQMSILRAANRSADLTRHFCREGLSLNFAPAGWFIAALLTCGVLQTLVLIPYTLALRAVYDVYLLELRDIQE